MAGSNKVGLGFSTILKSLTWSTLNLASEISPSVGGISLVPPRLPSLPKLLTLIRTIALLTGSTSDNTPSYLTNAVVIIDSLLPRMFEDERPPLGTWD